MDSLWIYRDDNGEWRWKRVARNGEIVAASTEGYQSFGDCRANLLRVNGRSGYVYRGEQR